MRLGSERWHLAGAVTLVAVLVLTATLLVAASRLLAAAVPAFAGAILAVAYIHRHRDRNAFTWALSFDQQRAYGIVLFVSTSTGAIGYMLLASMGVGVPDAGVSLPWRMFGGFAVGATAGMLTFLLAIAWHGAALIVGMWRHLSARAYLPPDHRL